MSDFIEVANVNEIRDGYGKVIDVNGKKVALFHLDGKFYAIDNACKHRGGNLGEGYLQGDNVVCPLHAWEFNIKSGVCPVAPEIKVEKYEIQVEGGKVKVKIE